MRTQKTVQLIIDALMSGLLLVMFAVPWTGAVRHERLGLVLFTLFAVHNALNFRWYTALFRGPYNARRTAWAAINLGLLLAMLLSAYSGIRISQHTFAFLQLDTSLFWRKIHLCASYWGLILTGMHVGLHLPRHPFHLGTKILLFVVSFYGLYACWPLQLWNKLLFLETFSTPVPSFLACLAQHLALACLFALFVRWLFLKK